MPGAALTGGPFAHLCDLQTGSSLENFPSKVQVYPGKETTLAGFAEMWLFSFQIASHLSSDLTLPTPQTLFNYNGQRLLGRSVGSPAWHGGTGEMRPSLTSEKQTLSYTRHYTPRPFPGRGWCSVRREYVACGFLGSWLNRFKRPLGCRFDAERHTGTEW